MNFREMKLTAMQIVACSRWRAPDGVEYLEVAHVLPFFQTVAAGAVLEDIELGTPARYNFAVKLISFTGVTPGTLIQVQWPDGRYLSNPGVDFFSFVGTGRRGRLIWPHKIIEPGQKIRLNIDNTGVNVAANLPLFFEGVLRVPMVEVANGRC